ncbi:Uncharacterised protein [Klebsiella pneumoniae]|uniref:hypothetical protein n=1 Tax=Klebsiella pneumoniae TaxID=573 RepID=UPI000E2BBEB8|nr:hypothetical protein [Klebsiella pneumoniae]SVZ66216.1 Uncharacterised protein [Klebsiella pneumoniae]SVZ95771.1 Uncharacterised protein [Klebsiella pneumoniae]SWA20841.1 Uncharacterised protein [Klebsiella pneumoniae]
MRKALACFALLFLIAGCDESSKTIITDGADNAIKMFKSEMNEGDHPPFIYKNLAFKPDHQNSSEVLSGWVCGDGSMVRDTKTYDFKFRGHVIKTNGVSYVGDLAALLSDTEMAEYDILYNKYCK